MHPTTNDLLPVIIPTTSVAGSLLEHFPGTLAFKIVQGDTSPGDKLSLSYVTDSCFSYRKLHKKGGLYHQLN